MFLIIFLFNLSLQKLLPKNVHWAVSSGSEQKFTSKDNILYERVFYKVFRIKITLIVPLVIIIFILILMKNLLDLLKKENYT